MTELVWDLTDWMEKYLKQAIQVLNELGAEWDDLQEQIGQIEAILKKTEELTEDLKSINKRFTAFRSKIDAGNKAAKPGRFSLGKFKKKASETIDSASDMERTAAGAAAWTFALPVVWTVLWWALGYLSPKFKNYIAPEESLSSAITDGSLSELASDMENLLSTIWDKYKMLLDKKEFMVWVSQVKEEQLQMIQAFFAATELHTSSPTLINELPQVSELIEDDLAVSNAQIGNIEEGIIIFRAASVALKKQSKSAFLQIWASSVGDSVADIAWEVADAISQMNAAKEWAVVRSFEKIAATGAILQKELEKPGLSDEAIKRIQAAQKESGAKVMQIENRPTRSMKKTWSLRLALDPKAGK